MRQVAWRSGAIVIIILGIAFVILFGDDFFFERTWMNPYWYLFELVV